jgi:hypothetical protein
MGLLVATENWGIRLFIGDPLRHADAANFADFNICVIYEICPYGPFRGYLNEGHEKIA